MCISVCVCVCVPWYLSTFAPKPPSATQHLFIFRFKQLQKAVSGDKELLSALMPGISPLFPLAHFAGFHLPSCSSGIQSKISAGSGARLSFSLAGLWKCQQRNHVKLTSSRSLHQLMYELEEWKSESLLVMVLLTWINQPCDSVPVLLMLNLAQSCP